MSTIDERLERLVTTSEAHTRMITSIAAISEDNTRQISELRSSIASLLNVGVQHQQSLELQRQSLELHQQNFNAAIARIDRMGDEIRGLQTENRRILDQLINRENGNF
jgi:hypothetical protein